MTRHARVAWRAWRLIASVLVLAAQVSTVMPAGATDVDDARAYPARPVHLIVAFSAGTAVDGLARFVGGKLEKSIGHQWWSKIARAPEATSARASSRARPLMDTRWR